MLLNVWLCLEKRACGSHLKHLYDIWQSIQRRFLKLTAQSSPLARAASASTTASVSCRSIQTNFFLHPSPASWEVWTGSLDVPSTRHRPSVWRRTAWWALHKIVVTATSDTPTPPLTFSPPPSQTNEASLSTRSTPHHHPILNQPISLPTLMVVIIPGYKHKKPFMESPDKWPSAASEVYRYLCCCYRADDMGLPTGTRPVSALNVLSFAWQTRSGSLAD